MGLHAKCVEVALGIAVPRDRCVLAVIGLFGDQEFAADQQSVGAHVDREEVELGDGVVREPKRQPLE